jgi:hypothetical protein
MVIKARNILADENLKTSLTNSEVAGTNVLRWKNPAQFGPSWAVQIGKTGMEQSEVVVLGTATPSGTAGTLTANTLYAHPADTPLYAIKFDQMVFERATAGTSGTATPLTNGTVTIQADSPFTIFDDTTGTAGYGYRTYHRNSVTGETSVESDWITSSGLSFYSLGKIRQRVKDGLQDATYIPDDSQIDDWVNEWHQQMNNTMLDVNEDYGIGTCAISFTSSAEFGTITSSDFSGMTRRVWWVDNTGTYQAFKMDSTFPPEKIFNSTKPYYFFQGDSVIGRRPIESAGSMVLEYQKQQSLLTNDTDEVPVPMRGYTKSYVDYGLSRAKRKDNKQSEGDDYETRAYAQLEIFKKQITPRMRSQSTFIEVVEPIGNTGEWL